MYRKMLPTLSETEQVALEAGTVGWEGELFAGNPDWDTLLEQKWPELTEAEKAFVDGPAEELCNMLKPWENSHELADIPPEVVNGKVDGDSGYRLGEDQLTSYGTHKAWIDAEMSKIMGKTVILVFNAS